MELCVKSGAHALKSKPKLKTIFLGCNSKNIENIIENFLDISTSDIYVFGQKSSLLSIWL